MEIYEEMKSVVRIRGRVWTEKGVRQGCPLSPLLFNLSIANMEEGLGKDEVGM